MIPTTTGAAKATSLVIPELKGKLDGIADARADAGRVVRRSRGRGRASRRRSTRSTPRSGPRPSGPLKGILEYTDEELVSSDYIGNPHSCILDAHMHERRGRHARQGLGLVRQRVGLLDALRRPAALRRRAPVAAGACPCKRTIARPRATPSCAGKRVFVRVDFNVPLDGRRDHRRHAHPRGAARRSSRCADAGARVVLLSHLGRPKGKPEAEVLARAGRRRGSPSCSADAR